MEISGSFWLEAADVPQSLLKHRVSALPGELKQSSHLLLPELLCSLHEAIEHQSNGACSRGRMGGVYLT